LAAKSDVDDMSLGRWEDRVIAGPSQLLTQRYPVTEKADFLKECANVREPISRDRNLDEIMISQKTENQLFENGWE
jgi:hypothetical protein